CIPGRSPSWHEFFRISQVPAPQTLIAFCEQLATSEHGTTHLVGFGKKLVVLRPLWSLSNHFATAGSIRICDDRCCSWSLSDQSALATIPIEGVGASLCAVVACDKPRAARRPDRIG